MLYRYLEPEYPKIVLNSIADLSKYGSHFSHFQNLSRLAFEEFVTEQVIFYSLPDSLIHFGLLDDEKDLHAGGGSISYNFLHLTLQEFLAAYYISHTTLEMQAFQEYGHVKRWRLIWRFVAGFTKLQYFGKNFTYNEAFVDATQKIDCVYIFSSSGVYLKLNLKISLISILVIQELAHFDLMDSGCHQWRSMYWVIVLLIVLL